MINTEKLVINKKVYETIRKARHVHEFYTYKDKPVDIKSFIQKIELRGQEISLYNFSMILMQKIHFDLF